MEDIYSCRDIDNNSWSFWTLIFHQFQNLTVNSFLNGLSLELISNETIKLISSANRWIQFIELMFHELASYCFQSGCSCLVGRRPSPSFRCRLCPLSVWNCSRKVACWWLPISVRSTWWFLKGKVISSLIFLFLCFFEFSVGYNVCLCSVSFTGWYGRSPWSMNLWSESRIYDLRN